MFSAFPRLRFAIYIPTDSARAIYVSCFNYNRAMKNKPTKLDREKVLTKFDREKRFHRVQPKSLTGNNFEFDYWTFSTMDFWSNSDMRLTRLGRNINSKPRACFFS